MSDLLRELEVLTLDCQATGASPDHGDVLELGWARCRDAGIVGSVQSFWVVPKTGRRVRQVVRELTGWTDACMDEAVDERIAWTTLCDEITPIADRTTPRRVPTVIHFARFELPFLRDLHARLGGSDEFPFDAVCLHAIAARLFPDLPRRSIRALSGYLGHSPELVRRAAGHVEATAFIWREILPLLEKAGIVTWTGLKAWLETESPTPRRARRVYPLAAERRRALPDEPGIYRFLRRNGDVVYVGKATSLRKRVASHFKARGPVTERGLELLTQVSDVAHTVTKTLLEAALLETDEIKRLDPPYNVQLKSADRAAWFVSKDFRDAVSTPDDTHHIGPLPSPRALLPLWALGALTRGEAPSPGLRAAALSVPVPFLPDEALFLEGWRGFSAERLATADPDVGRRVEKASLALWLERGRDEGEAPEASALNVWDVARVRRRLDRSLVQSGLLLRRARFLCLLAGSTVAFREPASDTARCISVSHGELGDRCGLPNVTAVADLPMREPGRYVERRRCFDAAIYDRLRVLLTELRRILDEGGDVALRVGRRTFAGERLAALMRAI
jgi:DNA polymerase III subunit epsilon